MDRKVPFQEESKPSMPSIIGVITNEMVSLFNLSQPLRFPKFEFTPPSVIANHSIQLEQIQLDRLHSIKSIEKEAELNFSTISCTLVKKTSSRSLLNRKTFVFLIKISEVKSSGGGIISPFQQPTTTIIIS